MRSIGPRPNVSAEAAAYLARLGASPDALFYHTVAILHAPAYRAENAGALRQDWPRVPLPASAEALQHSAGLGRRVAALLNPEQPVPLEPFRALAAIAREGGGMLSADELALTAGWGYGGRGGITMPGQGRLAEREATAAEQRRHGRRWPPRTGFPRSKRRRSSARHTLDIYLNDSAYWSNIPARVWGYTLGGYPVLKKWLSYREQPLLGRPLTLDEVNTFSGIARRIAALLLVQPALDQSYARQSTA